MKKRLASLLLAGVLLTAPCASMLTASADTIAVETAADGEEKKEGDYTYVILEDGTVSITKYEGTEANVKIPSKLGGKQVTVIGNSAFKRIKTLVSVEVPEGVTTLEEWAIGFNDNLETVKLPSTLKSVNNPFPYCEKLVNITIPNGVERLYFMFFNCSSLKSATVPGSAKKDLHNAFRQCTSLTSVTIEEGVEEIGIEMFRGCSSLTEVTLPQSATRIWLEAFKDCENLKKVVIPSNVTDIASNAFENTPNVTIYGAAGSYAQEYAQKNNIPFALIGSEPAPQPKPTGSIMGDLDGDGKIRSADALIVLRMSAGLVKPTNDEKKLADINSDGKILSNDALEILRFSAGQSKNTVIGKAPAN